MRQVHDRTFFSRIYDQDAFGTETGSHYRNGERRFLYGLSVDQREQADFRLKNPDIFERLVAEFESWNRQMLPRIRGRD